MFRTFFTFIVLTFTTCGFAATADFQDLTLAASSFYNNGSFTSGGAGFNNSFTDFGGGFTGWEGFAYSNMTDTTTPGFGNQYSAIPGHGASGSTNYAVGFVGDLTPTVTLPAGASPVSLDVTNTTYAYLSMLNGDQFAKKFGGTTGNDPDFFTLTITGMGASNNTIGQINFDLADFEFADNSKDYIVNTWTTIDLTSLAGSQSLLFTLASSDNGQFGMNTPAYFALDNVVFTPEPGISACVVLFMIGLLWRGPRAANNNILAD